MDHRSPLKEASYDLDRYSEATDSNFEPTDEARAPLLALRTPARSRFLGWCVPVLVATLLAVIATQTIFIANLKREQNHLFTSSSMLPYYPSARLETKIPLDGISTRRNIELPGSLRTKYSLRNETQASAAWEAIEAGHGLVAVDLQWAAARNLPPTERHPGDASKVVYVMEAYHNIHCIKMLRRHFIALEAGKPVTWPREHDLHCFDTLRQHVMCMADDTLLKTRLHRDAGEGQMRMCRDWDALREWATEHTACYHDDFPAQWGRCDGGDDGLPVGSLLD